MGALRRSGELVKGMWWRVFGIYSAMMTIYIMIQLILIISIGYLFYLFLARNDTPTNILKMIILVLDSTSDNIGWGLYLIQIFVTTGLNAITLPIITSGFTLLYFDLRVRKEAFDLELQAKQQQDINEHQS